MNKLEWVLEVETACQQYGRREEYDTLRDWRKANPGVARIMCQVNKLRKQRDDNT